MNKKIKIIIILSLSFVFALSMPVVSYADYTRVSESVNLREKPTTESKTLKLVPMGYEVSVQDRGREWSQVIFEGTTGYVRSDFLEDINGPSPFKKEAANAGSSSGQGSAAASGGGNASAGGSGSGSTGGGGSGSGGAGGGGSGGAGGSAGGSGSGSANAGGGASTSGSASAGGSGSAGAGAKAQPDGALRFGSEGEDVKALQRLLTEKGVYEGPVNGKFGPLTEEALKIYQEAAGLEVDGVAGNETMKKLTEKPRPTGTFRNGDEGEDVRNLQKLLKDKGYYSGPLNGKFGPLTQEAVLNFQRANGLEEDGVAGKATMDLLKAPAKKAEKSESAAKSGSDSQKTQTQKAQTQTQPAKSQPKQIAPNGVELAEWKEVTNILKPGLTAQVYDVRTGVSYYIQSFSNGLHADVEPVTVQDTELLKKTFGGVWSWTPRPVWVAVSGRVFAASINGMPHAGGVNDSNGMNGQICLHFLGSSTHNGNKAYSQLHQDTVMESYKAARG